MPEYQNRPIYLKEKATMALNEFVKALEQVMIQCEEISVNAALENVRLMETSLNN